MKELMRDFMPPVRFDRRITSEEKCSSLFGGIIAVTDLNTRFHSSQLSLVFIAVSEQHYLIFSCWTQWPIFTREAGGERFRIAPEIKEQLLPGRMEQFELSG